MAGSAARATTSTSSCLARRRWRGESWIRRPGGPSNGGWRKPASAACPGGVGPVPLRAPVGHGARGLQRGRRRLELLHPRPGPLARLPLGRGRPGRHLRRQAAALLRPRALERQGPDPQGAAVRPDQQRGQSRRGRQGVLLLPRQHADALVHEVPLQVPAGGVSLRRPGRDQPRARPRTSSSTSCSTPASSTRTATSTSSSSTPRQSPEDILIQITRPQPRPGGGRRCTSCRRSGSATPGRGAATRRTADLLRQRRRQPGASSRRRTRSSATAASYCDGEADAALHRERDEHAAALRRPRTARRTSRTASTTTSSTGEQTPSTRSETGTKAAAHYSLTVGAGEVQTVRLRLPASAPATRRARRRTDGPFGDGLRRSCSQARRREADEFYATVIPPSLDADAANVMRQALAGMLWSKQFYHYDVDRWLDGARRRSVQADSASARRATSTGTTCTTATSSRCRTSGSTPGTRPGTSPSTSSR